MSQVTQVSSRRQARRSQVATCNHLKFLTQPAIVNTQTYLRRRVLSTSIRLIDLNNYAIRSRTALKAKAPSKTSKTGTAYITVHKNLTFL